MIAASSGPVPVPLRGRAADQLHLPQLALLVSACGGHEFDAVYRRQLSGGIGPIVRGCDVAGLGARRHLNRLDHPLF